MGTDEVSSLWVVVFAHCGIPVKVRLFRQHAEAVNCQQRWEKTAGEEYDAVALFESEVR